MAVLVGKILLALEFERRMSSLEPEAEEDRAKSILQRCGIVLVIQRTQQSCMSAKR